MCFSLSLPALRVHPLRRSSPAADLGLDLFVVHRGTHGLYGSDRCWCCFLDAPRARRQVRDTNVIGRKYGVY